MKKPLSPSRLLILDIDGLRQDVFRRSLSAGRLPNLGRLFSTDTAHLDAISTAPSITFCAQTSIFTGLEPNQHGIVGNQFFDRFGGARIGSANLGGTNQGKPRFYAFDIGDALAVKDAVDVFSGEGLLNRVLSADTPTLYEIASQHQFKSLVGYHMLSRGADIWIRPNLLKIAAHTKGHALGFRPQAFDESMLRDLENALAAHPPETFNLVTAYFMGVDLYSHHHAPGGQPAYLEKKVDPQIGTLLAALEPHFPLDNTLVAIVSDHGQIEAQEDDRHSLRLSFPFDREMATLFDSLGLDVHDKPGEGPDCEAVVACNGGMAHVYLRPVGSPWQAPARFAADTLRVANAFWQANLTGAYSTDLQGALSAILVRQVDAGDSKVDWLAPYQVFTPQGLLPLDALFRIYPDAGDPTALPALASLAGKYAGDLLLLANGKEGFYFGAPLRGVHGGLQSGELRSVCSLAWLGANAAQARALQDAVQSVLAERRGTGAPQASIADLTTVICRVFGW